MLVEFNVTNYKSIKDRLTLSMVASKDKEHPNNTFEVEGRNLKLLRSIAIYGANASGKSNVIEAMSFMRYFVLNSSTKFQAEEKIPVEPFRLDIGMLTEPSEFETVFLHNNERYVYGFSASKEKIHDEWLTAARSSKPRLLFKRKLSSNGEYEYSYGKSWSGDKDALERKTRNNALFLSVAMQFNNPIVKPVFDWLGKKLTLITPWRLHNKHSSNQADLGHSDALFYTMKLCAESEELKSKVKEMIRIADVGIDDFEIVETPFAYIVDKNHRRRLQDGVDPDDLDKLKSIYLRRRVVTLHKVKIKNDITYEHFDLEDNESDGTIQFFSLIGPWLYILKNNAILVLDELDTSLHSLLSRYLIKLLHDHGSNDTSPQLIFTTHDCNLLDADLFRRDQIWFTEKDELGSTHAYSLWDYKNVRGSENFRKGYLDGRYGAIPFVGEYRFEEKTD